ncbi:hypothetical protein ETU10_02930 [Apibacter muscae]|uniref:Lipoprotein n=1 Tax=Apibacter muscae TaxID=2509004 RepID=A0A563DGP7_9FLAO|nr:hypothetical protein [Apibacter muscae]TWP24930.1 hypothetical protein ETU10_02930 [Apibacter muscae]TWP29330.1 hypothetical protein ETU09_03680 [Apibacter muscae]
MKRLFLNIAVFSAITTTTFIACDKKKSESDAANIDSIATSPDSLNVVEEQLTETITEQPAPVSNDSTAVSTDSTKLEKVDQTESKSK